jgi:hypothetical protein
MMSERDHMKTKHSEWVVSVVLVLIFMQCVAYNLKETRTWIAS